ncbi:nucleotidyltransferase family protein [Constantimarinum furrinae]|uniref:Mannose-1-phosphate guanylyltransferase n=1 Tax=Constantimarinum furrinae TaxID=2562285 RepID=A0A7G8PQU3_9FLAO|nr:nucleotidyltransferase family protein [Constantimarinum furrinae]QNJ96709.1 mannose-1-phosphate guanylyltransferase [Constantimarinum furrinae]
MKRALLDKISHLLISQNESLTRALKQMDAVDRKLLLVIDEDNEYKSLLSVGDIQRHLIKNQDFNAAVFQALRPNLRVASTTQSKAEIRTEMLKFRMEFMPVLSPEKKLVDVIFWEDLFEEKHTSGSGELDIPVVIMAGGKGTRLRPITNIIPKPLIPIGQKPIIEHIIDRFVASGSKTFYLSVNYKAAMIKNHFDEITDKDYEVRYFEEDRPSGTAGSLSLLKDKIHTTFFVSNCDILLDQAYEEVYKYHKENKNELTLIGAVKNYAIPYGTLQLTQEGLLKEITEKPEYNFLVNAGFYVIEPQLLQEIPEGEFFHITHLMEKITARNGRIGVFPVSEASWMDVGNWVEYNETLKKFGESPFL